jgi:lysyl endopeptidase
MHHLSSPCRGFKLTLLLLAFAAAGQTAFARERPLPPSFEKSALLRPLAQLAREEAPPPDIAAILEREAALEGDGKEAPQQFAAAAGLPLDFATAATWESLPGGGKLGRLRLASPGARSLNLTFSRFELEGDAALWIYSPDGGQVQGPFRAGDAKEGRLWSPLVLGDELVAELSVPEGAAARLELEAVNHGFRAFGIIPTKQSGCHVDAVCPEGNNYRNEIRSVGRYTLNGVLVCTGTLVNNTALDRRPLFLSAEHCAIDVENARSMVVYWNYQSPTCGALSGGSLADNQAGATLLARSNSSDFALVELDEEPADDFDVYYAGWDATGAIPQKVVAIHHPSLDEKALSFENDPLVSEDIGNGGQTHWKVRDWDMGSTEGGSSGACIFDQLTRRCVGTLTGGFASCSNNFEDYFGKFSRHWLGNGNATSRLSNWLDPIGAIASNQPIALDGLDPDTCVRNDTTACLADGRFQVRVRWNDGRGGTGYGKRKEIGSNSSVLFWFFSADNVELLVKVLNACGINQRFWVYGAASTDVEYTLEIIDRQAGDVVKTYFNQLGVASPAITDSQAFATCN